MSYFSNVEDGFSGPGCGPKCSCGPCKSGMSGLGEWYVKEQPERQAPSATAGRARQGSASQSQVSGWNGLGFGEPAPVFRFECPIGCPPLAEVQCRRVVRRAIRDGIRICSIAAAALEANPRTDNIRNRFRRLFGHDPSRPVPWADNKESGAIVAHRLRKVAEALQGRGTLYRCIPCGVSDINECPLDAPTFPCPLNAQAVPPNTVELCPRFFAQTPTHRAGIVIHEMLHLIYLHILHDPRERRRNNAHCYEAFALRAAGHTPDRCDLCRCRRRPA